MKKKYLLNSLNEIELSIKKPCLIFLKWDLWAGKTTFVKHIVNNILGIREEQVSSPTYTYFNKYADETYHFDLYRLDDYEKFFFIGGEEILDNNRWVIIIEWPELIEDFYKPDIMITIRKTELTDEREMEIEYLSF